MAIVRCTNCGHPQANKPPEYGEKPYLPAGGLFGALICGTAHCRRIGLIWLKLDEEAAYAQGERIFDIKTGSAKVAAQDGGPVPVDAAEALVGLLNAIDD